MTALLFSNLSYISLAIDQKQVTKIAQQIHLYLDLVGCDDYLLSKSKTAPKMSISLILQDKYQYSTKVKTLISMHFLVYSWCG
jgi:hypothetical protein